MTISDIARDVTLSRVSASFGHSGCALAHIESD